MKTLIYYVVYLVFGFGFMILFYMDFFPPITETSMATILFWTFIWAISVTQVVEVGKLFRRFSK